MPAVTGTSRAPAFGPWHLLVAQRRVAGAEVDGVGQKAPLALAAAHRLVRDRDVRVLLRAIRLDPLLVERRGERRPGAPERRTLPRRAPARPAAPATCAAIASASRTTSRAHQHDSTRARAHVAMPRVDQLNWPETYSFVSCSRGLSKIALVGPDSTR